MSAPHEDAVYLGHIRDAISRIGSYLQGVTEEQFLNTPLLQDGVIRQLEIIGEATKRLSKRFRQCTPDVPWRDVSGMRDKLAHDYMGVDLQAVWDSATIDVIERAWRTQARGQTAPNTHLPAAPASPACPFGDSPSRRCRSASGRREDLER